MGGTTRQTGPRVTALAPWFGSKRTLAPEIVRVLGPHRSYWEPFCGSMAVLLAKPRCSSETVNDLHGDLVNLARCVQDEDLSRRLDWKLRRTLVAEALFRESLAAVKVDRHNPAADVPDVDRAYHFLVASWTGMNGVAGTFGTNTNFARRFSNKGGAPATRFAGMVESLPWWHERLRGAVILSACGIDLCERIDDDPATVVYVDPPYFVKGAKYLHDFVPADHERLAAAVRRFRKTRVVVSYYPHPEVDRLYAGWTRVNVELAKGLVNAGKRDAGRTTATEVLLVNGSVAEAHRGLFCAVG